MFPKKGSSFPVGRDRLTDAEFAQVIASALKVEFGSTRNGTKMIMKWTGVSDRTAKNWLNGTNAPSGVHLILLARDQRGAEGHDVDGRRPEMSLGASLLSLRRVLGETIAALDQMM
ncbi:MAG: hypothetical protein IPO97_07865 [Sphingomonadales bacterium]|nr:hypothetical protein [Sphingomonadales bacterium]